MRYSLLVDVDSPLTLSQIVDQIYDASGDISLLKQDSGDAWDSRSRPSPAPEKSSETRPKPERHGAQSAEKPKRPMLLPKFLLHLRWGETYSDDVLMAMAKAAGYVEPHRVADHLLEHGRMRRREDGLLELAGHVIPIKALGLRWSKRLQAFCESLEVETAYTHLEIVVRLREAGFADSYFDTLRTLGLLTKTSDEHWIWGYNYNQA